jgi:hypothetical protein
MEIQQERVVDEAEDSSDIETEESTRVLTRKGMAEAFQHLRRFLSYFHHNDLDTDRSSRVAIGVENAANCYNLLYNEKKKVEVQLSLNYLFSRKE